MKNEKLEELKQQAITLHNGDKSSEGDVYQVEVLSALIIAHAIYNLATVFTEYKY